jgi:glyoxylase-like metal-dependent hydrolase (beta-lactamase superfamily II)
MHRIAVLALLPLTFACRHVDGARVTAGAADTEEISASHDSVRTDAHSDRDDVAAAVAGIYEAINSGNADLVVRYMAAAGYTEMTASGRLFRLDEAYIRRVLIPGFSADFRAVDLDVRVYTGVALVTGYRIGGILQQGAAPSDARLGLSMLWVRDAAGSWRLAHVHLSPAPAPTYGGSSLDEIRRLAAEVDGPRPVAVHVLAVNTFPAVLSSLVEGAETRPVAAMNAVFQIRFADDWIMVDAVADATMLGGPGFSPTAFDSAMQGLSGARAIVLTHEHHDHAGGIFQAADSLAIAARTLLTAEQRHTLATAPNRPAIRLDSIRAARFQPFAYETALPIAAGVVLIKAPGHTPGSQLVYVQLASGEEIILAGDVAWMMAGIRDMRQKPPDVSANVALLGVAEDRVQIARQLDWLRSVEARGVHVVVAHDRAAVDELVERGVLAAGLDLRRGRGRKE